MLKYWLALSCTLLLCACGSNTPDSQSIIKEFKYYHSKKDLDSLLDLFNEETMHAPYRKALRKVLTEEVNYPIKSISLVPITYNIPEGIYNISPTQELVVEYDTDYQLSSVYLLGILEGKTTLAWIQPPAPQNSVAPLVENTQSRENSNHYED